MSLSFIGPKGAFERRWIVYALLRDNVQHYLEDGAPSGAFATFHAMAEALGASPDGVQISAPKLRSELLLIQERLRDVPITDLAISLRTRAVTTHSFPLPEQRTTELARVMGWAIPFPTDNAQTVGQLFQNLIGELLRIVGDSPEGVVTIVDT